jgi:hypothetical protein
VESVRNNVFHHITRETVAYPESVEDPIFVPEDLT